MQSCFNPFAQLGRCCLLLVIGLTLAACGGGGGGGGGDNGSPPSSLTLTQREVTATVTDDSASETIGSLSLANIQVDGLDVTAEQFEEITLEFSGEDAALFAVSKSDSGADLIFNPAATQLEKTVCGDDLTCTATLIVSFEGQSDNLTATVTLDFPVASLDINSEAISDSAMSAETKTLVTLSQEQILTDGAVALDAEFAELVFTVTGEDDLFTVNKGDNNVELIFNADASALEKATACGGDLVCTATLIASVDEQTAELAATVNLTFPVTSLEISATPVTEEVAGDERKVLLALSKEQMLINGEPALDVEFTDIVFSVAGVDASLFTVNADATSAELIFNSAATALEKATVCGGDIVCTASLTASFGEQTAELAAIVTLDFPVTNLAINGTALSESVNANQSTSLLTLTSEDLLVDGAQALDLEFAEIVFTVGGVDAGLFIVNKDAASAELVFNPDAADLDKATVCGGDLACSATLIASLDDQVAELDAAINLDFPVTALEIIGDDISDSVENSQNKTLLTLTKENILVNTVEALAAEFSQVVFTVEGDDASLFSLNTDADSAELVFNADATDLEKFTVCGGDLVCSASLSASLGGQSDDLLATIDLIFPIEALEINQAPVSASAPGDERTRVLTLDPTQILVNGEPALDVEFSELIFSVAGEDETLFTVDQGATSAELVFNPDATELVKTEACGGDIVCVVTLTATLGEEAAELPVTINLAFPVDTLEISPEDISDSVSVNMTEPLVTLAKEDLFVNGEPALAAEFSATEFALIGENAELFALDQTDSQVTLIFNPNATPLEKATACGGDIVCSASLTASLGGQDAELVATLTLQFPVAQLEIDSADIIDSVENTQSKTLLTLNQEQLLVDGQAALAAEFAEAVFTLSGDDEGLFEVVKGESSAEIVFNPEALTLVKADVCGADLVCNASLSASLGGQSDALPATVTLEFPVTSLAIAGGPLFDRLLPNESKLLLTLTKDQLLINDEAALAVEFAEASFDLSSDNSELFTLVETDTEVTLSFNIAGTDIGENTCTDNSCSAILGVSFGGEEGTLAVEVGLVYSVDVILSALLTDEGHYFFFQRFGSDADTGNLIDPEIPLPILPLMVARATGLDGASCAEVVPGDAGVDAYNASLAQRTAYVENCALTPEELGELEVSLAGYTPDQDQDLTDCQQLDVDNENTNASRCAVFVRQPNNPQPVVEAGQTYGLADRIEIVSGTVDYFASGGMLETHVNHISDYLKSSFIFIGLADGDFYFVLSDEAFTKLDNALYSDLSITTNCNIADDDIYNATLEDYDCIVNEVEIILDDEDDFNQLFNNAVVPPMQSAYQAHLDFYRDRLSELNQPLLVLKHEAFVNLSSGGIIGLENIPGLNTDTQKDNIYPVDILITGGETDLPVSINLVAVNAPEKAILESSVTGNKYYPITWPAQYTNRLFTGAGDGTDTDFKFILFNDRDDIVENPVGGSFPDMPLSTSDSIKFTSFHSAYGFDFVY